MLYITDSPVLVVVVLLPRLLNLATNNADFLIVLYLTLVHCSNSLPFRYVRDENSH